MCLSKSEQARVNGAKSSGPKSPAAKARSSRNSLKHGIFARVVVLNCESKDVFETYSRRYFDRLQPVDEPEVALVEKIVHCVWRQHRLCDIERVLLEKEMSLVDPGYPLDVPPDSLRLVEVFTRNLTAPDALDRLSRMEASLDRQAARAYRRLRLLQQDRRLDSPPAPPQDAQNKNPQNEPSDPLPPPQTPQNENPQNEPKAAPAGPDFPGPPQSVGEVRAVGQPAAFVSVHDLVHRAVHDQLAVVDPHGALAVDDEEVGVHVNGDGESQPDPDAGGRPT